MISFEKTQLIDKMQNLGPGEHAVGLASDQNMSLFRQDLREIVSVRLIIHATTIGPNSGISENHVTTYLIIEDSDEAVRIDMRTYLPDIRGVLVWSRREHQVSNSALTFKDYPVHSRVRVRDVYKAIRDEWFLHRYLFSGGGSGCRYWA